MPFIGKDWRSPGEAWIKTDDGSWEKMKILETSSIPRHPTTRSHVHDMSSEESTESDSETDQITSGSCPNSPTTDDKENTRPHDLMCRLPQTSDPIDCPKLRTDHHYPTESPSSWPPHVQITLKSTKEVAGYNTISEAFHRLDFTSAIKDIRRFNYVTKLLHLLINQNLTSLSGCATRVLFSMLEELAWEVASSQQNVHVLHQLLEDLRKMIANYYCWGRPLGSTQLWDHHLATLQKLTEKAKSIEIKGPSGPKVADDGQKRFDDLPEELIREVLLRLSDYKDLVNASEATPVMSQLVMDEEHIWRELCRYHFTDLQVKSALGSRSGPEVDWESIFQGLRKKYGLKEEFADTLVLCRYCRCLFWKSFGHPCVTLSDHQVSPVSGSSSPPSPTDNHPLHVPVPPQAFLKFFSL